MKLFFLSILLVLNTTLGPAQSLPPARDTLGYVYLGYFTSRGATVYWPKMNGKPTYVFKYRWQKSPVLTFTDSLVTKSNYCKPVCKTNRVYQYQLTLKGDTVGRRIGTGTFCKSTK